MDTWVWILLAAVALLVVIGIVWAAGRKRRTERLREGFGPEYDRTLETSGGRREAESELLDRQKRREELDIRPLPPGARDRYAGQWQSAQTRFVDDPRGAIAEADRLVQEVMRERGYPTDDFERRSADISVDHPELVENYREAHRISVMSDRDEASTEDQRQAMVHYRSLFEELLEERETEGAEAR